MISFLEWLRFLRTTWLYVCGQPEEKGIKCFLEGKKTTIEINRNNSWQGEKKTFLMGGYLQPVGFEDAFPPAPRNCVHQSHFAPQINNSYSRWRRQQSPFSPVYPSLLSLVCKPGVESASRAKRYALSTSWLHCLHPVGGDILGHPVAHGC